MEKKIPYIGTFLFKPPFLSTLAKMVQALLVCVAHMQVMAETLVSTLVSSVLF